MEMIALVTPRYDIGRFGSEVIRATPRQSDLMIVSGRVSHRMAAPIRQLYEQMLEPKWVLAMGACSSTGGMFANYAILQGVDKIIPVDVYVPGCPPRPEAVIEGILTLQKKIKAGIPPAYEQQRSQRVSDARSRRATDAERLRRRARRGRACHARRSARSRSTSSRRDVAAPCSRRAIDAGYDFLSTSPPPTTSASAARRRGLLGRAGTALGGSAT